jgi:hypothetical protein
MLISFGFQDPTVSSPERKRQQQLNPAEAKELLRKMIEQDLLKLGEDGPAANGDIRRDACTYCVTNMPLE